MPDSFEPSEDSAEAEAQQRARAALERGIAAVDSPAAAARVVEDLEQAAGDLREEEVAEAQPSASLEQQAEAIEAAANVPPAAQPAEVIATTAAQSVASAPEAKPVMDEAIAEAMGSAHGGGPSAGEVRRGRRLLRHELFRRLRPLQAIDAVAFVQINQLPHTRLTDRAMRDLSWVMTAGTGWLVILLLATLADRRRGWQAVRAVVPALWLATATVEYPIKKWFRRRRPFVALVEAIIVGRKPGSYSFPSGHSAAAFAGALLLAREYPERRREIFALASMVGFSRIYLGVHYPGDVISGSFLGMAFARLYSRLLRKTGG